MSSPAAECVTYNNCFQELKKNVQLIKSGEYKGTPDDSFKGISGDDPIKAPFVKLLKMPLDQKQARKLLETIHDEKLIPFLEALRWAKGGIRGDGKAEQYLELVTNKKVELGTDGKLKPTKDLADWAKKRGFVYGSYNNSMRLLAFANLFPKDLKKLAIEQVKERIEYGCFDAVRDGGLGDHSYKWLFREEFPRKKVKHSFPKGMEYALGRGHINYGASVGLEYSIKYFGKKFTKKKMKPVFVEFVKQDLSGWAIEFYREKMDNSADEEFKAAFIEGVKECVKNKPKQYEDNGEWVCEYFELSIEDYKKTFDDFPEEKFKAAFIEGARELVKENPEKASTYLKGPSKAYQRIFGEGFAMSELKKESK